MKLLTWLPKPMPIPSIILPKRSMTRLTAEALRAAPTRKLIPPHIILMRRPWLLVMRDAARDVTKPAKYKDEVNAERLWLSYLQ